MIEKSQTIIELSKALLSFQNDMDVIVKDQTNPFFKGQYATLANILASIKEPLQKNSLVFTQLPTESGLVTLLIHTISGEYIQSTYPMPVTKGDGSQALGSAITYARRYALGAILGLNIDKDDDGNSADGKATGKTKEAYVKKSQNTRKTNPLNKPEFSPESQDWERAITFLKAGKPFDIILEKYFMTPENIELLKSLGVPEE
jgi:hypothetical protein